MPQLIFELLSCSIFSLSVSSQPVNGQHDPLNLIGVAAGGQLRIQIVLQPRKPALNFPDAVLKVAHHKQRQKHAKQRCGA